VTGKGDGVQHPRRFYRAVTVTALEQGHAVLLDGRSPKAPGGTPLVLPTAELAQLTAAEWDAQDPHIIMLSMPAVRLAWTALEKIADAREAVADEIMRYAGSDLLCYRAEGPKELVAQQAAGWDPLLAWARDTLDVAMVPTTGVIHRDQPAESLARVRQLALALGEKRSSSDRRIAELSEQDGLTGLPNRARFLDCLKQSVQSAQAHGHTLAVLFVANPWVAAIIVGLIVMVMLHEAGHLIAARKSGMKATEYFLGFGPRRWSFKRGETEYGVKAIPADRKSGV